MTSPNHYLYVHFAETKEQGGVLVFVEIGPVFHRCGSLWRETRMYDTRGGYKIFTYGCADSGLLTRIMIHCVSREHPYFGTGTIGRSNSYSSMQWNKQPLRSNRKPAITFER